MSRWIPYEQYHPGRFADMAAEPLAEDIWRYLSARTNVERMSNEADAGRAPIAALGHELHERFGEAIELTPYDSERVHTMVNNMVKQIMEREGYRLSACTLLRDCPFCSSSGLYARDEHSHPPAPSHRREADHG